MSSDRILSLTGRVTAEQCLPLVESVRLLDQKENAPLLFVIDTAGGDGVAAEILGAAISFCRSPTIGLAITRAASAGFTVLQACDLRLALTTSSVLAHHSDLRGVSTAITNTSKMDALVEWRERKMKFYQEVWESEVALLCRRSGLDPERAKHLLSQNRLLSAKEAYELGFIDGVV